MSSLKRCPFLRLAPFLGPRDRRRRLLGILEEVFQVPAQILLILGRETEIERRDGRARSAVAEEIDLHPVAALGHGVLPDPELKHHLSLSCLPPGISIASPGTTKRLAVATVASSIVLPCATWKTRRGRFSESAFASSARTSAVTCGSSRRGNVSR